MRKDSDIAETADMQAAAEPGAAAGAEPTLDSQQVAGSDVAIVGEAAAVEVAAAAGAENPMPAPVAPTGGGPLTAMMALAEPKRTAALEAVVQSGDVFTIRSRTGGTVKVSHGEHVLQVPPAGKPFVAGHAIHLLWTAPDKVEEVAG